MQYTGPVVAVLCGLALAGCGTSTADRTLSGAGLGTAAAIVVDADPLAGAVVGGAAGALTDPDVVNLGTPWWRRF